MIIVIKKTEKQIRFKDIPIRSVFLWGETFYFKTEERDTNCVDLVTGELIFMLEGNIVELVDNCKLTGEF